MGLTARAVGEKAMKAKGVVDETAMVKLLAQYSERLLEMLDDKFAVTLAKAQVARANGEIVDEDDNTAAAAGAESATNSPGRRRSSLPMVIREGKAE